MKNCVAAIQYDEETGRFVLVAGAKRLALRRTKALTRFVTEAPDIDMDIIAALKDQWFPDAEFEAVEEEEVA